jgi:hypothetical protein
VDVTKEKAADVPSTSGTNVTTFNQFDALNMDDTEDFGIWCVLIHTPFNVHIKTKTDTN